MTATALLSIEEALSAIAAEVQPLPLERVPVAEADGRVLAAGVSATLDLPPFTNSAMDGFALRATDAPGRLEVVGESSAGSPYAGGPLAAGTAVAISTGAVMPDGADAVAPIEIVTVERGGEPEWVKLDETVRAGANVRVRGTDARQGDAVLPPGLRIRPAQIAVAASIGAATLSCGRQPRVAVLATGTELRAPGEPLGPGQIYDSNGPMLRSSLARAGAIATVVPAAADTREAHRKALSAALAHDVVVTAGGVSVGEHDLVREVERELGVRELFWRISMRPGKPLSFGLFQRSAGERTLVFGLPGNPVSALVCFELFIAPALLALQGAEFRVPFRTVRLGAGAARNSERDDLIRVRLSDDGQSAEPLTGQQSYQISVAAQADGVVRIPVGEGELPAGSEVSYLPLR